MSDIERDITLWNYDIETDILFFRDNKLKYHSSIILDDLIVELDENEVPMGMELLNASLNFNVPKVMLINIQNLSAEINTTEKEIKVKIKISVISRNTNVEKVSVSSGVNDINLQPGQTAMVC
jgi:uncharacterized protein YuzE